MIPRYVDIETIFRLDTDTTDVAGVYEAVRVVFGFHMVPHTVPAGVLEHVADAAHVRLLLLQPQHVDHQLLRVCVGLHGQQTP